MSEATSAPPSPKAEGAAFAVIAALSVCHLLNDLMQSVVPAIYPLLKDGFQLSFSQIGLITLAFNLTASVLQPAVGLYTDRRPKPFSLAAGMAFTCAGLALLAMADAYWMLIVGVMLMGTGSAVFHPEASRVTRLASGGRHGFAQSVFQVGGNFGSAAGPLLAALVILPYGQGSIAWLMAVALTAFLILFQVSRWYRDNAARRGRGGVAGSGALPRRRVATAMVLLCVLIFSKYVYLASITSYFTFYLIETFGVSVRSAQLHLFLFLGAVAVGTYFGGPLGDRFGRLVVIRGTLIGVLPFTLALPHAGLFGTAVLSVVIGVIIASAFSTIVVYAQELMPGRVGAVSGLLFGFAFGMGGLGAAVLGVMADMTGIGFVYQLIAWLPVLGLAALALPDPDGSGGGTVPAPA